MGHVERFPPTRLSAGFGFRKETIAEMRRNGRDAPIPDLPAHAFDRGGSHLKPSYGAGIRSRISSFGRHCFEIRGVFGKRLRYREQPSTRPQNGCARSNRERVIKIG